MEKTDKTFYGSSVYAGLIARLPIKRALCLPFLALLTSCMFGGGNTPHHAKHHHKRHERGGFVPAPDPYFAELKDSNAVYRPPGPQEDPWRPYILRASERFDMPAPWIRAVIKQESGGRLLDRNGKLITSSAGAMGLMQLMPSAYKMMSDQLGLGDDPYNPNDNIMAGTAYLRQLYEVYGSPGFLAAYNAGPGTLEHYLKTTHRLPPETRNYVARISPYLRGTHPQVRSRADLLVLRAGSDPNEVAEAEYYLNYMKADQNLLDTSTIPPFTGRKKPIRTAPTTTRPLKIAPRAPQKRSTAPRIVVRNKPLPRPVRPR